MRDRHPSTVAVTRFFEYEHLPEPLYSLSMRCAELKDYMLANLEDDPELVAGLRKLIEAKDCFVRAKVAEQNRLKNEVSEGKPIGPFRNISSGS